MFSLLAVLPAAAQTPDATVRIRVTADTLPLAGAQVRAGTRTALTSAAGVAVLRLPAGQQRLVVAKLGFRPDTLVVVVRAGADTTVAVTLVEEAAELEEIVVTAARVPRRIEDEPTRVEILGGDDIAEKAQMRPSDLVNFVSEMSGVRIQPTAPGRGGASVRIQGLRGQYTLVLTDGLPLGGGGDGLELMQMPPLDFRQAEVIKGAATALYGPTALGGVLNLVSRRPDGTGQVMVNGGSRGAADAFLYGSRRLTSRLGASVITGLHHQTQRDTDGDGWTNFPGFDRVEVRPRLVWDGEHGSTLLATVGGMAEDRDGGTVSGATVGGAPYPVVVNTRRFDGGVNGRFHLAGTAFLGVRAAASRVSHQQTFGAQREPDRHTSALGEVTLSASRGKLDGLVGVSWQQDAYRSDSLPQHDYTYTTPSVLAQGTWAPAHALAFTLSGRCDDHNVFGTSCNPRASLLVRPEEDISLRLSAGTGFFAPTPFTDATIGTGLSLVQPMSGLRRERLRNLSLDATWEHEPWQVNVTAYTSRLSDPAALVVQTLAPAPGTTAWVNAQRPTNTSGGEVFVVREGHAIVFTAWYAYVWSSEDDLAGGRREAPLNPRHNAFVDVAWEGSAGTWVALEVGWFGRQALDGDPSATHSRPYTFVEFLAAKQVGRVWLFVNAGNLGNVVQSDYAPVLRPGRAPGGAWTVGQWAPLEGVAFNGGFRLPL